MDITRAWKDEEYRLSLSEEERALLLDNPAGLMELSDAELESIMGGDPITVAGGDYNTAICSLGTGVTLVGGFGYIDSSNTTGCKQTTIVIVEDGTKD